VIARRELSGAPKPAPLREPGARRDGRSARAERTRTALTAAVLHLLDEGATRPTSEQIAQRAEVSERSLYQHFPTREELLLAAWQLGRAQGRSAPIPRSLSLGERIGAIADTRAKLWEVLGPSERAIRRCDDRTAAAALAEERDRDRAELARLFDPEIAGLEAGQRMVTCAGLATVCGWSTWEALRVEQGLSVDDARQTLACLLRLLLLAGEPMPPHGDLSAARRSRPSSA
jgi:TetR/AcrR family transcriptional regulator, regulator of autoinduction and epiphytic fitness